MKKVRYFKCTSSQKIFERWVHDTVESIDCECKAKAVKQLSAPRFTNNSCGKNASWS